MFRWMFDGIKSYSAKWDIIGMSVYPYWVNLPWATDNTYALVNMQDMIARYQTKVMVVETGYLYNQPKTANNFLFDLISKTKSVDGLGVFYWEPERYSKSSPGSGYQLGAWNPFTKKPTTAMDAFLGIKDTSTTLVRNISIEGINIYPNPLTGNQNLTVSLKDFTGSAVIKIVDVNGRQLYEAMLSDQKNIIISNLEMSPGMYFVQITNPHQKIMKVLIVR
jgi:hypothetical protein